MRGPRAVAMLSALTWGGSAAGEVARVLTVDRGTSLVAAVGTAVAAAAGLAIVRLLRRPPRRAADPAASSPRPGGAPAETVISHLSELIAHATERGEATPQDGIGQMVAAAHARDPRTLQHSFRVARYAATLARRLGADGDLVAAIEWGGLLHDVGKVAVPVEILHKAGPLTAREAAVMRRHPRRGYQILRQLVFLGPALDVVLSHHERWDGSGYPNHLAGEEIPLAARIFAIADTYDAITSDRPYRPARSHLEAVRELELAAGSQLDPRLVTAFLDLDERELTAIRERTALEWPRLAALTGFDAEPVAEVG